MKQNKSIKIIGITGGVGAGKSVVLGYLKENYPSGYLTVPTFGAGTANTEFEVITGMNIDYFGTGEYPYNTVLKEKTCETLANNLRAHGYYSTAIHNNTATFYDRNLVFANMGFDRFVSSDFMSDLEYTSVGWVKDNCMVKEIEKALSSTVETDLVYAISVQPHGKYPDKYEQLGETLIDVTFKKDFSTDDKVGYTYFIKFSKIQRRFRFSFRTSNCSN